MINWNLWHGCHKISPGCQNCYVYRMDARYDRNASVVKKTGNYNLPLRKGRDGGYKIPPGSEVFVCGTSDFFLEDADEWRAQAWEMMRERKDLEFLIITKRIHRFLSCIPEDWGDGYENVTVGCTVENQDRADFRLPIFLNVPLKHRGIVCEPLLEKVELKSYLNSDKIEYIIAGGESGNEARVCDFDWILDLREQCIGAGILFYFKQTGALFRKDGKLYRIPRKLQHVQARKADIDYSPF
ncbi:MAG: DUF5131 family protein [Anaerofustis sp.]